MICVEQFNKKLVGRYKNMFMFFLCNNSEIKKKKEVLLEINQTKLNYKYLPL